MSNTKNALHIVLYLPRDLVADVQRLADDEMIERAAWMKRAILNDVNRIRKLRDEPRFKVTPPSRKGPKPRAKTILE